MFRMPLFNLDLQALGTRYGSEHEDENGLCVHALRSPRSSHIAAAGDWASPRTSGPVAMALRPRADHAPQRTATRRLDAETAVSR